MTPVVILVVSLALGAGCLWGLSGRMSLRTEGFLVAMAGGALIVSVTLELIEPAARDLTALGVALTVAAGAITFTLADMALEKAAGDSEGSGLLLAITFDGVPENLALGVALIGAGVPEVAALAGSILLSNLPEAAGGAKSMRDSGMSHRRIVVLWFGTAALLAACALIGNVALREAGPETVAIIKAFAAGAVTSSLATEVFPQAYAEDRKSTGFAVALGLIVAFLLGRLSGG